MLLLGRGLEGAGNRVVSKNSMWVRAMVVSETFFPCPVDASVAVLKMLLLGVLLADVEATFVMVTLGRRRQLRV